MKKVFIFLTLMGLAFSFAPKAAAQDNPFGAGNILVGAYTGLPTQFSGLRIPPIGITVEYGISDFGHGEYGTIGAGVAYEARMNRQTLLDYDKKYNLWSMQLSPYACYHYFFNESLEVHAKAGFGWNNYEVAGLTHRVNTVALYEFAGASYFISPALALTAEIGISGVAFLHLGANFVF